MSTGATNSEYPFGVEHGGGTPVVGTGLAVGFQPEITIVPEGSMMSAAAVVSSDLRYVRLAVIPNFSTITEVFTFTFVGSNAGQMQQVQ